MLLLVFFLYYKFLARVLQLSFFIKNVFVVNLITFQILHEKFNAPLIIALKISVDRILEPLNKNKKLLIKLLI